jgi:osmoprotectant transport system substrate-binding protein
MALIVGRTLALVALLLLAGCGGGKGKESLQGGGVEPGSMVVGSADFPESKLLAEIYAQALSAKQIKVSRKFGIGSREVYFDQLKEGAIHVIPEYNGALLNHLDRNSKATTAAAINQELGAKLPDGLRMLAASRAEDKDTITVTRATATKHKLKSIADLAPVAGQMVMGGPPPFKTRYEGKLKTVYGVRFKQYKSLDLAGPISVAALKKGDVQAADLFTTDPSITINGFVALADPKAMFGAQNVTPLIFEQAVDTRARAVLDAVSAKLDTPTLGRLMARLVTDKEDVSVVAGEWLRTAGL